MPPKKQLGAASAVPAVPLDPLAVQSAAYSSIPVWEIFVNNVVVMRRKADDWLNATQLLKVAGVEKARRTRYIERELFPGVHEKVQGGYGKYQGTWIPFERGLALTREFSITHLVRTLLDFDPDTMVAPAKLTQLDRNTSTPPRSPRSTRPPSTVAPPSPHHLLQQQQQQVHNMHHPNASGGAPTVPDFPPPGVLLSASMAQALGNIKPPSPATSAAMHAANYRMIAPRPVNDHDDYMVPHMHDSSAAAVRAYLTPITPAPLDPFDLNNPANAGANAVRHQMRPQLIANAAAERLEAIGLTFYTPLPEGRAPSGQPMMPAEQQQQRTQMQAIEDAFHDRSESQDSELQQQKQQFQPSCFFFSQAGQDEDDMDAEIQQQIQQPSSQDSVMEVYDTRAGPSPISSQASSAVESVPISVRRRQGSLVLPLLDLGNTGTGATADAALRSPTTHHGPLASPVFVQVPPPAMPPSPRSKYRSQWLGYFHVHSAEAAESLRMQLDFADADREIDVDGNTPAHWAATLARAAVLRDLVDAGADVAKRNRYGETPLMRAAHAADNYESGLFSDTVAACLGITDLAIDEAMRALALERLSARDKSGHTVFHHIALGATSASPGSSSTPAAASHYLVVIAQALAHIATPCNFVIQLVTERDADGYTAGDLARRHGLFEVAAGLDGMAAGTMPQIPIDGGSRQPTPSTSPSLTHVGIPPAAGHQARISA